MKWRGRKRSENVIDVGGGEQAPAGRPRAKKAAVGGGLGMIVMAVVALIATGGDLSQVLSMLSSQATAGGMGGGASTSSGGSAGSSVQQNTRAEKELVEFIEVVLGDTEQVWHGIFAEMERTYEEPKLYRFRKQIDTACGFQSSAIGPFYCPADKNVYLDLDFFDDLARRHGAAGDFAQAYVIAHEVGHHIQNILGIADQVHRQKRGKSETQQNQLSVRQELHADFLAGVWAHHARQRDLLDRGDLAEALNAAAQIGDDTLQRKSGRQIQPDGFTHGTAAQRQRWFELGFNTGDMKLGLTVFEKAYRDL